MKAKVDKDICTGCGLCADTCPEVFSMTDDVAVAITEDIPDEAKECCKQAAEDCPVAAITVKE
jgi:ferredoxin